MDLRDTSIERPWRDAHERAIGGGTPAVMLDEAAERYGFQPGRAP